MTIGPVQPKVLGLQHPDRTFTARITEEPERSPKTDTVRAIEAVAISKAASEELEAMYLRSHPRTGRSRPAARPREAPLPAVPAAELCAMRSADPLPHLPRSGR
jgi:hypothetical protein